MLYLVAGYKSGAIALWDMKNYTLGRLITDAHTSEITGARIYNYTEDPNV
jgi:WD40 repeat protein